MTDTDAQFDRCSRCGAMKSAHILLQDAVDVTVQVLLCPRATYQAPVELGEPPSQADVDLQTLLESA